MRLLQALALLAAAGLTSCGGSGCPDVKDMDGTWVFTWKYDGDKYEYEIDIDDGEVSLTYDGEDSDYDCEVEDSDFCDLKVVCEYDGETIELTLERQD